MRIDSLTLNPKDRFFRALRLSNIDIWKLSPKERLTFYECRDARSWEEWNPAQQKRKRKQLEKIFDKFGNQSLIDELGQYINFLECGKIKVFLRVVYKASTKTIVL